MAVTLDGLDVTDQLPKEWAETTMKKAFEQSVVGQLSNAEPMPTNGKFIPVYEGGFEVGHTPEMGRKPASDVNVSINGITPWKFAGLLVVSREAARANPGRMMEIVQQDTRNAVQRQLDLGIFYGLSAYNGSPIPNATAINTTTERVELDTASDLVPQFLAGYDLIGDDYDADGFAFDSRYRTRVSLASQQQLAPAGGTTPMPNLAAAVGTFGGLPAAFGRAVAGRVGTNPDTGVRGFVGAFDSIHWGFSSDIELTRSDVATVIDGDGNTINAFQDNAIVYRLEFEAGWFVNPAAFAAYDENTGGSTEGDV